MRAIAAEPDDPAARLIYADWLEERGDVRAEFIRLHARLAEQPEDEEFFRLLEREQAMRPQFDSAWLKALGYDDVYARLFRLDEGLWLEELQVMLRWGVTIDALENQGSLQREWLFMGRGEHMLWLDCAFWRGLRGFVAAPFGPRDQTSQQRLHRFGFSRTPRPSANEDPTAVDWERELKLRFGSPTIQTQVRGHPHMPNPATQLIWRFSTVIIVHVQGYFAFDLVHAPAGSGEHITID